MNILRKTIILAFSAGMLVSCSSKEAETPEADVPAPAVDTTAITVDDTTKFKFDFAIANIPSPAASMQAFQKWKVPFDGSTLNNPQNASKYATEFQRSLNLGVYNIDMAYAMMNNKGPEVLSYMKSTLLLSDALGLKNAVDAMIGKRAEANLAIKDSLFAILDEMFMKSDSYLRTNDRVYTAATVFAGSWIENLFLTSVLAQEITDPVSKAAAYQHLWEQRFHLGNLINLLSDFKDKKEAAGLIASLTKIHESIVKFHQSSEITDANFKAISEKIIALRNKITA
jgi:hypothetical protein